MTPPLPRSALLLLALAAPATPAAAQRAPEGGAPPADGRLARAARTTDTPVAFEVPATRAEWERRAEALRLRVAVAAGAHLAPPRAARLETHGAIDRGDYTVERAWFESHPGHFVTGNLYRPKGGPARKPGVLCPHGHWTNGRLMERSEDEARALVANGDERELGAARSPLQARCAQLARLGCVVLHYDMLGYGDSRQFDHHASFAGVEDALRLQSLFGFQTWDSLCALDALCALPDVDPARIAVTGASGGGTQTFVLTAIDPRVTVALPAVMVSEHFQGGCRCENGPHLRVGTGNAELAALAAPRPLALTGADDWTRNLETAVLPPLKAVYGLYGAAERVDGRCWPEFEHNYNVHAREYAYGWLARHLELEVELPVVERLFGPLSPAELSVFDAAHPALPERARPAAEIRAAWAQACDAELGRLARAEPARLVSELRAALGVLVSPRTGALRAERVALPFAGPRGASLWALSRGEATATLVARLDGAPGNDTAVVCVLERGPESFPGDSAPELDAFARLVGSGATVVWVFPLLAGAPDAAARLPRDAERHATYHGFTHAYERTLFAERVDDVLAALEFVRSLEGARRVRLLGLGRAGAWALCARALAGDAVDRAVVDASFDFAQVRSSDDPDFLPGALRYGGLAGLAAANAPGALRLLRDGERPEVPALPHSVYAGLDAERHVSTCAGAELAAALDWLAER